MAKISMWYELQDTDHATWWNNGSVEVLRTDHW